MSEKSAKTFVERLQSDEDFAQRVADEHKDSQTLRGSKVLLEEGFSFTKDELDNVLQMLPEVEQDELNMPEMEENEISEDELANVAGGIRLRFNRSAFTNLGIMSSRGRISRSRLSSLFSNPALRRGVRPNLPGFGGACGISTAGGCSGVA